MKVECTICKKVIDEKKAIGRNGGLFGSTYFCSKKCAEEHSKKITQGLTNFFWIIGIFAAAYILLMILLISGAI